MANETKFTEATQVAAAHSHSALPRLFSSAVSKPVTIRSQCTDVLVGTWISVRTHLSCQYTVASEVVVFLFTFQSKGLEIMCACPNL